MRKSTKLKIFRRKKRSVILSVLKRHSLRQHTSDMSQEEKEDVIVMEITYLNGRTETAAIWICLDDNGEFKVSVSEYQITEEDKFIFQPDSQPINHQP